MELIKYAFFQKAIISAILAGIACGMVGVWIIIMRISFIGVAISHSAFAGALLAILLNKPVIPFSFLFCFLACAILGPISDKGQLHPDTSIGIIFSSTLGLAFLFMGLIPESKSQALNLLWGSILTVNFTDILILLITDFLLIIVATIFFKEIQSVIFNRELAKASGISATVFFYLILLFTGMSVGATLKSIGGILVFALIVNPAASAYQITYSMKKMYFLSCLFAIISGLTGLFISAIFNLPSGASIIITSSFIFILSLIFSPKRKRDGK